MLLYVLSGSTWFLHQSKRCNNTCGNTGSVRTLYMRTKNSARVTYLAHYSYARAVFSKSRWARKLTFSRIKLLPSFPSWSLTVLQESVNSIVHYQTIYFSTYRNRLSYGSKRQNNSSFLSVWNYRIWNSKRFFIHISTHFRFLSLERNTTHEISRVQSPNSIEK